MAELHIRASQWYEDNGLEIEAFQHAAAAHDVERAERLIEGKGMPLHYRARWPRSSTGWTRCQGRTGCQAVVVGHVCLGANHGRPDRSTIEEKLQAAEAALARRASQDDAHPRPHRANCRHTRHAGDPQNQIEAMIAQSHRALEYLHPDNLPVRTTATWTLGFAYQLQGDRAAASQAYTEAIPISQASGNTMITIAAATCLGQVQESENQLHLAAETYRRVLELAGDPPLPAACEAHLGLARISYQWNDLETAQQHGQQSLQLAQQMENVDTPAVSRVILGRLKLAQGDAAGATVFFAGRAVLAPASLRPSHARGRCRPGTGPASAGGSGSRRRTAETHGLPISQARVHLAQGDASAALAVLEPLRRQAEARDWQDERLKVMVLRAIALHAQGEKERALQMLAKRWRWPNRADLSASLSTKVRRWQRCCRRLPIRECLELSAQLLAAFGEGGRHTPARSAFDRAANRRELEVLRLLATYLNGPEIARDLMVSLNTLRTHTKNIYQKLGVNDRQAAVRRAEELGLL